MFKQSEIDENLWKQFNDNRVQMLVQTDQIVVPIKTLNSNQINSCILYGTDIQSESFIHNIILSTIDNSSKYLQFDSYTTYGIYDISRDQVDKSKFLEILDDLNIFNNYQSDDIIENITIYLQSKDFGNCELFIDKVPDSNYKFLITIRTVNDNNLLFEMQQFNDKVEQQEIINYHYNTQVYNQNIGTDSDSNSDSQIEESGNTLDIWDEINRYRLEYSENYIEPQRILDTIKQIMPGLYITDEDFEQYWDISQDVTRDNNVYAEKHLELTSYNQNPIDIQGYKYMKSFGIYQVDSAEQGEKQYSLVGQLLPVVYNQYGYVSNTVQNSVTAIWTRTGDFQYRVELPDISELQYSDTVLDDYIAQQKLIYDNSSDQMFYKIYDSKVDKNHRTLTVLHTTKDTDDPTFNNLTDIDTMEVIDYKIETYGEDSENNQKFRLTVQIATVYNGWFNRFSDRTLQTFAEWLNINKIESKVAMDILVDIYNQVNGYKN